MEYIDRVHKWSTIYENDLTPPSITDSDQYHLNRHLIPKPEMSITIAASKSPRSRIHRVMNSEVRYFNFSGNGLARDSVWQPFTIGLDGASMS